MSDYEVWVRPPAGAGGFIQSNTYMKCSVIERSYTTAVISSSNQIDPEFGTKVR